MSFRSKLFHYVHPERVAAYEAFSGPAPAFPMGNQGAMLREAPWQAGLRFAQEHGDLTLIWIKSRPVLLASSPRLAQAVLQGSDAFQHESTGRLLGTSSLNGDHRDPSDLGRGDAFHSDSPPLSLLSTPWIEEWLEAQLPALQSYFAERATAFAKETMGSSLPLHASMLRVVFAALTRMTLGQELSHQSFEDLLEMTLGTDRKSLGFEKAEKAEHLKDDPKTRLLKAIATRIAQARRYPEEDRTDLIGHLLKERYALEEDQWAAALLQILISGCQPIAASLTSTFHLLTLHTPELEKLESELASSDSDPSPYGLRHMPQLDAVYRESLRLAPPIPLIGRRVKDTRKVELHGRTIPAGTGVLVNLAAIQRHKDHWSHPDMFKPERWMQGHEPIEAAAYLPGGAGAFACPAQNVCEVLTKQILFSWLRNHTIMAGEGREQGYKDRLVKGIRIPHWVDARLYKRRTTPAQETANTTIPTPPKEAATAEPKTTPRQRPAHVTPVAQPRR
ncbi:MAG: cytochrome P450 [Planctomycetota bacterium]|nr:cytochrome P450 [Planctomycetota bacterium]